MSRIHATCIAIDDQGILITGPSGSGKSDLGLRLIEQGASLVSDDYTELVKKGPDLIGYAPPSIAGLLEVRHLGVIRFQHLESVKIRLVIDLCEDHHLDRLPDDTYMTVEGIDLAKVRLCAFHASAPAKVGLALAVALGHLEKVD